MEEKSRNAVEVSRFDGIRARLGSIAPIRMQNSGTAITRLLSEDMPLLIALVDGLMHNKKKQTRDALAELDGAQ